MSKFIADEPVTRIGENEVAFLGNLEREKEALAEADRKSLEPTGIPDMGCAPLVARGAPVCVTGKIDDDGEWRSYFERDGGSNPLRRRNNRAPRANCTDRLELLRYGRFVVEQIARAFDDTWRVVIDADTDYLIARAGDKIFMIPYTEVLDNCHVKAAAEACIALHRKIMGG